MRKIVGFITLNLIVALFPSIALAANDLKIAVVNVTELYNQSTFIQKMNNTLQEHYANIIVKLQTDRNKLQALVSDYEKTTSSNKKLELSKQIASDQTDLSRQTQEFQQKIQEEQDAGLQQFTQLVQTAVAKVAKDKQINSVLNSTSILYTDNSWIDITNEVQAVMAKN